MTSLSALESLAEDMLLLPDPRERIAALVSWGNHAPEIAPSDRSDSQRVRGCISSVWLDGSIRDGICHLRVASDSAMVRGLVGVTVRLAHMQEAAILADADLDWPAKLRLENAITPTRLNGLAAVASAIRNLSRTV